MKRPDVLALIPARGGSKSVPRKNLLRIAGRPLIEYSIAHAKASVTITRIIVSTDDAEIAEVARAAGAEVPFLRPAEHATDTATDLQVFRHALEWLAHTENYRPELVVHLRPTGPVRDVALIDGAVTRMLASDADALRSVSLAEQTPYKMWTLHGDVLCPLLTLPGVSEAHSMPRQQLPAAYWQNGHVDIVRPHTVLRLNSMVGQKTLALVVDGPIHELDYPEQIPALEAAVLAAERGDFGGPACPRHPA